MERKVFNVSDSMMAKDRIIRGVNGRVAHHYGKGVLLQDMGMDAFGRPIFKKVAENTVTLAGAIQSLEALTGVQAAFRPKTLNELMQINHEGHEEHVNSTPIALFGCGIGGATLTFNEVKDPNCRQTTLDQIVPMMVSAGDLTGANAGKYMMKTTINSNPDGSSGETLNAWYLKEFEAKPTIRALWKDGKEENEDGNEITQDVADVQSENGVEAFASFKLVIEPEDIRSYFEATGNLAMARFNTIGLFTGEKILLSGSEDPEQMEEDPPVYDYVNVRLFSVLNMNNEPLAERKQLTFYYRIYAMI